MWDYAIKHIVQLKNRVLTFALLYKDKDVNVITSITLYRAFIGNYPDFDKLRVFGCKAILYKIEVKYPKTFKPYIKVKTWIFIRIEGNSIQKVLNVKTLVIAKTINTRFNKYTFPQITSKKI